MAEEVKVSKFAKLRKGIVKFAKEVRSELKKVIWPTKEQLTHNTITVIATCIIIGAVIWCVDWGLTELLKFWVNKA